MMQFDLKWCDYGIKWCVINEKTDMLESGVIIVHLEKTNRT